jgi:phospholipase C
MGRQWETLFDRAAKSNPTNTNGGGGPTYRYYNSDLPFSALFGLRGIGWTHPISNYYAAAAAGTLPNITFVDPPFKDGSGGDGLSGDEHPHGDVRIGQSFMSDVVHAFLDSPQYERGALFIVYDEWGGFFDHVKPPQVPDDRASKKLDEDFSYMGFRTPTVIVSPYTKRQSREQPRVNHKLFGHESIIKMITYRFGLGDLVLRDGKTRNIGEAFNFHKHDFEPADLPDVAMPAAVACSAQLSTSAKGGDDHQRELEEWEAYAKDLGYEIGDPADAFRDSGRAREVLSGNAKPEEDSGKKHHGDDEDTPATGTTPEQTTTPQTTTPQATTPQATTPQQTTTTP